MPTSSLAFPHPHLTTIIGTPTKLLTKEIYANAHAIPSTQGSGKHGHLGFIMTAAAYLVLAGVAFQLPTHLGDSPNLAATATQYQLAEGICQYKATIAKLSLAITVCKELKKLILAAVNQPFLSRLDNDTFGFAQVLVTDMLTHLQTTYGTITCAKLESN